MNKTRLFMFWGVIFLSLALVGIALAADNTVKQITIANQSTGEPPTTNGVKGIESLNGSFVAFDPSVGFHKCHIQSAYQTFCLRAESFTTDEEFVQSLWVKFPANWGVTDVHLNGTPVCSSGGGWGSFNWSYQTQPNEINIAHYRYQAVTDHCTAYYCFDVTIGLSNADTMVSWYYQGDDFVQAPHHPCSNDNYTPAGQDACDEAINPPAIIPVCDIELTPARLESSACENSDVTYNLTLTNTTGNNGTFLFRYDSKWITTGPQRLSVNHGEAANLDVGVHIPWGGASNTVAVTVSGLGYTDISSITTKRSGDILTTWEGIAPILGSARLGPAAAAASGKVYLVGGSAASGPISTVEEFNPATGSWATKPTEMPYPAWNACAGAIGTDIYVLGGNDSIGFPTDYLREYHVDTDSWSVSLLNSLPAAKFGAGCAVLDGKIYIFGGTTTGFTTTNTAYSYDPNALHKDRWSVLDSMTFQRTYLAGIALNGKVYAIGGSIFGFPNLASVEAFDPADGLWHTVTSMNMARAAPGVWAWGNYLVVCGGGWDAPLNSCESYDTTQGYNGIWTDLPQTMLSNRRSFAYASMPEGLYAIAGYDGTNLTEAERLPISDCPGRPDIDVSPLSLQAIQPPDDLVTRPMTICNPGGSALNWELIEIPDSLATQAVPSEVGLSNHSTQIELSLETKEANVFSTPLFEPHGGPVSLVLDDGSPDIFIGTRSKFIYLNRFTPDAGAFPFQLDQIQVYFGNTGNVNVGDPFTLAIYENPTGYPDPAPESILLTTIPITVQDLGTWNAYSLPSPVVFYGPGDVLIGVIALKTLETGYAPASMDMTHSQQRSWLGMWSAGSPPDPPILPSDTVWNKIDSTYPGNWMIRGSGETIVLDLPWVNENLTSGTLPAGGCQEVNVTFDSTGMAFGDYTGEMLVTSNDSFEPRIFVPLTMTVDKYHSFLPAIQKR